MKQAYALCAGLLINPDFHIAVATATVSDLFNKHTESVILFSCVKNAMCELYMGAQSVHVQHLCEK
jgi:hypothetical protein